MNSTLDWQELALFLAVARGGGLAPAARRSGLSAPTLSRRMTALEASVGERLFERGSKGYTLTGAGEALLERVVVMDDAASEIETWRRGDRDRRRVRISAGGWTPELVSDFSRLDLGRREIDLGIRNRRPEEPWLAGRRIGSVDYAVYRAAAVPAHTELGWVDLVGTDERIARTCICSPMPCTGVPRESSSSSSACIASDLGLPPNIAFGRRLDANVLTRHEPVRPDRSPRSGGDGRRPRPAVRSAPAVVPA